MRFKIQHSSPTDVDILVEGRVILSFRNIEGNVVCVARKAYDRKPAWVPTQDFHDARTLAVETMEDLRIAVEEAEGPSNTDIARSVLNRIRKSGSTMGVDSALDDYLTAAEKWCSTERRSHIKKEIGKIGGAASSRKAAARRRKAQKEERAARQGKLSL